MFQYSRCNTCAKCPFSSSRPVESIYYYIEYGLLVYQGNQGTEKLIKNEVVAFL